MAPSFRRTPETSVFLTSYFWAPASAGVTWCARIIFATYNSTRGDPLDYYVIGMAGGTGAGKTTLADELAISVFPGYGVVIHEDRYYRDNSHLPAKERDGLNFDHPDAIDLALLALHVRELVAGRTIHQPVYDFVRHIRSKDTVTISPARFIIVEGLFTLFSNLLWDVIDFKIFLDAEEELRQSRRIERDIRERGRTKESVIRQWISTVQPMHELFIQPSRDHADLILFGGDPIECNVARITDFLVSKNILKTG